MSYTAKKPQQPLGIKPKLNSAKKRPNGRKTISTAVVSRKTSGIPDSELNAALHHVMLDQELDALGAPKEHGGGKLSPFGRLRRIGPQLLADKRRLDWLEKHHATLVAVKERWGDKDCWLWQVVDGKRSLSGHPLATPREAIDSAIRRKSIWDVNRRPI